MPGAAAPLVTVVTPVWNAAATLRATVASVRAQSLPDWELILVDDASTDGSRALARALAAEDARIRLIERAANGGAAAARNDAIRAARGRLIAFLDADDRWYPEKLARQTGFMGRHGHALVYSAYARVDADARPLGVVRPPPRVSRAELLRGNVIGCLTAVYDTQVFGRVEMPPLRRRQDYGLWLTLLRAVPYAHGLDEVLADYRVRPASLSGGKLAAAAATWRLYREIEGLGRARAGFYLAHNLARALAKRAG
jgi:teichuronic acid biosynthesis glycosyltransferase TuaG